jgi:glycosyltransferase involved in cell wall biosynthesis
MECINVSGLARKLNYSKFILNKTMKKILHIITGLNNGGAEGVLYRLCVNDDNNIHYVISFLDMGKYGPMLKNQGIEVFCLKMKQGNFTVKAFFSLYKIIKKINPDIVQTWMYHADLIGGLCAKLAGVKNVFWNIRSSNLDKKSSKKTTWLIARICAIMSYFLPEKIICCAIDAKTWHLGLGYSNNFKLIGNGFDINFYNKIIDDEQLDFKWALNSKCKIIGMVARLDPQKDHLNLLAALSEIKKNTNFIFKCVLVGKGLDVTNYDFIKYLLSYDLENEVLLLGQRNDVPRIMASLDVHVLSSAYGEGFPNVVAESMCCGTPNVVTDVGDSKYIVGETGVVVSPRSSKQLAAALINFFEIIEEKPEEWLKMRSATKERAHNNFCLNKMIDQYHTAWSIK